MSLFNNNSDNNIELKKIKGPKVYSYKYTSKVPKATSFQSKLGPNKYANIYKDLNAKKKRYENNSIKKANKDKSIYFKEKEAEVEIIDERVNPINEISSSTDEKSIDRLENISGIKSIKEETIKDNKNLPSNNVSNGDLVKFEDTIEDNTQIEQIESKLDDGKKVEDKKVEKKEIVDEKQIDFEVTKKQEAEQEIQQEAEQEVKKETQEESRLKALEEATRKELEKIKNLSYENKTSKSFDSANIFSKEENNNVKKTTESRNSRRINNSKYKKINIQRLIFVLAIIAVVGVLVFAIYKGVSGVSKNIEKDPKQTTQTTTTKDDKTKDKVKTEEEKKLAESIKIIQERKSQEDDTSVEKIDYIINNQNEFTPDLINLLAKNKNSLEYVYSYPKKDYYNDKKLGSNVTPSVYIDSRRVPIFLQWDRRWGYRDYQKEMMGVSGCAPTSLAMVVRYFDKSKTDVNPYTIAQYSAENGYVADNNSTSWALFDKGLAEYGLQSQDVIPTEKAMKQSLSSGEIIIASIKAGGVFTDRGHILVIEGVDSDGNFVINDPNSIEKSSKYWTFEELAPEIRKLWGVSSVYGNYSASNNNTDNNESSDSSSDDYSNNDNSSDDNSNNDSNNNSNNSSNNSSNEDNNTSGEDTTSLKDVSIGQMSENN